MNNLYYNKLKLQKYFKLERIQVRELQTLFKWRVMMAPLIENFRGNNMNMVFPLCHTHLDNQSSLLKCEILRKEINIDLEINDIYCENITLETQKISEIEEVREKLLVKQEDEKKKKLLTIFCFAKNV